MQFTQERTFHNIPATISLMKNTVNGAVYIGLMYHGNAKMFENNDEAIWDENGLTLYDVTYPYGRYFPLNDELKHYLASFMDY